MLTGLGLGPGDPDLLTLRAVELLEDCDACFVPGRLAADLVEPHCDPELLDFPMTRDRDVLEEAWDRNAEIVGDAARDRDVVFPVVGDPGVLSTFNHLRRRVEERYPDVEIRTVPGVSALTAFLSAADRSLTGSFLVTDGSPVRDVVAAKAVNPRERAEELRRDGFTDFVLVREFGMEGEDVTRELPEESHYFTVLHGRKQGGAE